YEELPAVFGVADALAEGAPLVHEEPPRIGQTFADLIIDTKGGTNVCNHFKLRKGDVEVGFAEADEVFEDVFTSPPVQHVPLETHACVADVRDGRVTVWAGAQIPFVVRSQLAEIFRLPQTRVRVIVPTLGGGYGAKTYPKIEPLTAALSFVARRPVRLHLSREEEFVTITKHGVRIRMRTGVRRDGTITARQSVCHFDTGAYADIGPRLIKNGGYGTGGPHHIPNVWVDSYAVYTNIPPAGAFRGYGVSQAAWAYETQMDMIADQLGLDPLEFRLRNLLVDGQTVMTGEPMFDAHFRDLLGRAGAWIGWDGGAEPARSGSKVRAKGLSCIIKGTVTPSTSTALAKLNDDASLDVLTSSVEMGQGMHASLALMASQRLGVPVGRVSVSSPDTDVTPYDQQTSSSRTTHAMGTAVIGAVDQIREQLVALAADELEITPTDLELDGAVVRVKGSPDRSIGFGDLVRRSRSGNLLGSSTFRTEGGLDPDTGLGIGSVHWHQAAGAAEVEVDLETGRVEVLRYHAGVYAGRIINPVQAELQTEGNVAFGLGQALFEEMVFDEGQLQNGNLGDYMIASIEDLPAELNTDVLEHLAANDIHGIGETSLPPVMPAIGNAVYRATGVRITDLPITPEKVLRGLRARAGQEVPSR
ncbi:MAG TPA: molybdopterin cofactor-binding domain-containing protein, partial [Candidatus Limnocylindrales bacterium]|nr:molybdopterin cofactor-binding domain-containing protein [Candidatus Limnocylindrales bacterium]